MEVIALYPVVDIDENKCYKGGAECSSSSHVERGLDFVSST
jgi:hypothetical protein